MNGVMAGGGGGGDRRHGETERRRRLEQDLRRALDRVGVAEQTVESVMSAGCRLDGIGAAGLEPRLAGAGERLRRNVNEIAAALDRMAEGRYGGCESCGGAIGEERLDHLPTARRCRACAS